MTIHVERLPRAIRVNTYAGLEPWLSGFQSDLFALLFLIGRPGLGKSQFVQRRLAARPHVWLECHATKLAMYCRLYQHRNEPVVIDDENSVFSDPGKVSLMNALCQTNPTKTLRWDSTTKLLEERGVPPAFQTTSPVLVITNRLRNLSPPVSAMIDRGQPLLFHPTAATVHAAVADWFTDREIYDFIGRWLAVIPGLSMRDYVKAKGMKDAGLDWAALLHQQWRSSKLARVAALKADHQFRTEEGRVAAFVQSGVGSRATYFRFAKKLETLGVQVPEAIPTGRG